MASTVYIGLGSNVGDRELNLLRVVAEIGKLPATRVTGLSRFYESEPVGVAEQEDFLNAVARIETELPPRRLLEELQRIETTVFGRTRSVPGAPRRMDLDILLYDRCVINEEDLMVPHPRLHQRRFVLEPLCEISPDLVHPSLEKDMRTLLASLPPGQRVRKL